MEPPITVATPNGHAETELPVTFTPSATFTPPTLFATSIPSAIPTQVDPQQPEGFDYKIFYRCTNGGKLVMLGKIFPVDGVPIEKVQDIQFYPSGEVAVNPDYRLGVWIKSGETIIWQGSIIVPKVDCGGGGGGSSGSSDNEGDDHQTGPTIRCIRYAGKSHVCKEWGY